MTIRKAQPSEFSELVDIWEASVRATHDFLAEDDLRELRPRLLAEWLPAVTVMVADAPDGSTLGFMGVADEKLEMLFVAPAVFGKGVGKALLAYAIENMNVRLVDVNEQNSSALGFYQHAGFVVFDRSSLDGQGRPYPLLHMRLDSCASCFPERGVV